MRLLPALFLTLAVAGCGRAGAVALDRGPKRIVVNSTAIAPDRAIAMENSAYGANRSPALTWSPAGGARSYAIVVEDPDAPGTGPFVHWLIWNLPADARSLAGNVPAVPRPGGAVQGRNGGGSNGYYGPHPPSGVHHYHFEVFALDRMLGLAPGSDLEALARQMKGHVLASGEAIGTFAAPAR